jgi:hypothetical protein
VSARTIDPTVDPFVVVEQLDTEHEGVAPEDAYRQRIEVLMRAAMKRFGGPDDESEAKILRNTRGGMTLEVAARHTGFVMGFEYARDLLQKGGRR